MRCRELVEQIEAVDVAAADLAALAPMLSDLNRIKGWVSVTEATVSRRLTTLEAEGESPPAVDVLARSGHSSRRDAEKAGRRAEAYGQVPGLERQRAKGHVSDEHADAFASAAGKLNDEQQKELFALGDELARHAAASTPGQFARHLGKVADTIASGAALERSEQQRAKATLSHGINNDTGMGWIRAELHPDDYQKFKRTLAGEVAAIRKRTEYDGQRNDQVGAAAFMGLVTSKRAAATPPSNIAVLIDVATIINGRHAETTCEYSDGTPLPIETARRLACDANIIPVVLGGDGQPLDVGRAKRHATQAQRTALRSMHRTCAVGGCEREFDDCEVHHLAEWDQHDGPTDLENLLPLCGYHHHRVHEGRWRLQLDASTRELNVFLPDGSLHCRCLPDLLEERAAAA
jgi:hypothetical protein